MKTYKAKGLYGEGDVYQIETLSDFDILEKKFGTDHMKKYNPNFFIFKKEFKKVIGKILDDEKQVRYLINGHPVCKKYKVIGLEDNAPMGDYYWIVQNISDDKDVKYLLSLRQLKKDW